MVGVTASALIGVMNPLLGRLGSLLKREDANLQGVHRQILFLRDELSSMSTALEMVSESEEANLQVKEWMGQLRELSYDVEDCIDIFMHHLGRAATCNGFIQKIISKVITLKAHYHISIQINELKERVMEVEAAKATITKAAALLPNHPRHEIHIFGEEGMVEDEK
ncbi:hypothetical protein C2845_PM13G12210 [Panicum miliaceum]|uniref:Disease resistance N-terminal domain-containing protein n=1 Tax=Panicum miliaceum TaxID=4540 RepID=A0A3L6RFG6_PANMI|nr:hypothetical protein C2845_PM13G12210 [Panicum miliaceum]